MQIEDAEITQEETRLEESEVTGVEAAEVVETEETNDKPDRIPLRALEAERKQKQKAKAEADELRAANEALKQERDLALLGLNEKKEEPLGEIPNPDDFLDSADYARELQVWLTKRDDLREQKSKDEFVGMIQENQQRQALTLQQQELLQKREEERGEFLDQAESLNAPDFYDADKYLQGAIRPDIYDTIVGHFGTDAPVLAYHLGSDPEKVQELIKNYDAHIEYYDSKPVETKAVAVTLRNLGGVLETLKQNQGGKTELPDPDPPIDGGAGGLSTFNVQLEKKRKQKMDGKLTQNQLMDWIRENRPAA